MIDSERRLRTGQDMHAGYVMNADYGFDSNADLFSQLMRRDHWRI